MDEPDDEPCNETESTILATYDVDIEREFEEDMANSTAVRMKLTEAQALDSTCGMEDEPDEASLLFEEVLQERDNMV